METLVSSKLKVSLFRYVGFKFKLYVLQEPTKISGLFCENKVWFQHNVIHSPKNFQELNYRVEEEVINSAIKFQNLCLFSFIKQKRFQI